MYVVLGEIIILDVYFIVELLHGMDDRQDSAFKKFLTIYLFVYVF